MKLSLSLLIGLSLLAVWVLTLWALKVVDFDASQNILFLGRLHPMVLHIPIGLMSLVLFLELVSNLPEKLLLRFGVLKEAVSNTTWLIGLVLITTAFTILHGVLLYVSGGYEESELARKHLLGGSVFYTAASALVLIKLWIRSARLRSISSTLGALTAFIIMCISAHDGASLTHGERYLSQYAPSILKPILSPEPATQTEESVKTAKSIQDFADGNVYEVAIQPIFDLTCVECHKASKKKGKLRMDSYEKLIKGGASGDLYVANNLEKSLLLERIYLPMDDDEHMPPSGKRQPTDAQVKVLEWWILSGAPNQGSLNSHAPPQEILETIKVLPTIESINSDEVKKEAKGDQ